MDKTGEWLLCPVCGGKTRLWIAQNTTMTNFPLFCPKCKRESWVKVSQLKVTLIKEPAAQTQSR